MATSRATLSLLDRSQFVFDSVDQQVSFLQQKGLLASSQTCSACSTSMTLRPKRDISDGYIFRCGSRKTTKSLRAASFFSKSKLALQKWLILIYWWIGQYPVGDAAEEAKVSRETAINVYQWLQEVCSTKLLAIPIVLGGPQKVVQIDESLFRHKPKVRDLYIILFKNYYIYFFQHHCGCPTRNEVWVFSMVDISHDPALGYMEIVQQRDAATLLPIINSHVAPGTTVWSDQWAAYNRVASL